MVQQTREFASNLAELAALAHAFVLETVRHVWGATEFDTLNQLLLAVQEAAVNIVRHGYQDAALRPIHLALTVNADQVCLEFSYPGIAFDPDKVPPPSFDGSRAGGFGVYLIRQLVDDVIYARDTTGRCTIRLVKKRTYLSPKGATPMELSLEKSGNVAIVTVHLDELDASSSDDFKRQIASLLQSNPRLVLDLARVKFIDSSGCGAILSCLKTLSSLGGDLRLCGATEGVRKTFQLIRLNRICEIFPTRQEAVQAFQA